MTFCHIAPTSMIPIAAQHSTMYLTLAHLAEKDQQYVDYYNEYRDGKFMIMDNSAYEYYKMHGPGYVFDPDKLLKIAEKLKPDAIVLPDYPGEHQDKTIEAALKYAPMFRAEGYQTMFVPQSLPGDVAGLFSAWCIANEDTFADIIGFSIIAAPNAYNALNNPMQRYLSRYRFAQTINAYRAHCATSKWRDLPVHVLGMLDGPNEIHLLHHVMDNICSWDSSAAVWAACQDQPVRFDMSPTGLANGKIEVPVDFDFSDPTLDQITAAVYNMMYINRLVEEYTYE